MQYYIDNKKRNGMKERKMNYFICGFLLFFLFNTIILMVQKRFFPHHCHNKKLGFHGKPPLNRIKIDYTPPPMSVCQGVFAKKLKEMIFRRGFDFRGLMSD